MIGSAVSSGAIVLAPVNGKFKMALAHEPDKGAESYVIPKGHVEPGESREATALREVREETGLTDIQLVTYLGAIHRRSLEDDGEVVEKTIHLYLAFTSSTTELKEPARWLDIEDAISAIPFDEDRKFVSEKLAPLRES